EQRFGVEHKEYLKQLRAHVDVLTMSATHIPRTLEMSLTGIREMSTIATPPEERHPVLTFVGPYDDKQIAAAIRRELLREGQVFFVHNRVESIERAARRIAELVPEARIATAHGQMGEHTLEQVIVDFWEKRSDGLVCTTIVGTGVDKGRGGGVGEVGGEPVEGGGRRGGGGDGGLAVGGGCGGGGETGVSVFPVPAGEAADRDRARPAGHRRAALRPGRRDVRGDE